MSRITLYIAQSLDGFIADEGGGVGWLETFQDHYDKGVPGESYQEFFQSLDCLIIGAYTYEQILTFGDWPYGDVPTFVVTHRELPVSKESIRLYTGDLVKLVKEVIPPEYENIWLVGGADLAQEFVRLGLVDEIRLSVIPVLLGSGVSLFGNSGPGSTLHLTDVTAFKTGIVELWYDVVRNPLREDS